MASHLKGTARLAGIVQYQIDRSQRDAFIRYGQTWARAIPGCGADLVGYFAPHEGSSTLAYGIYHVENLAAYEAYRARLAADPVGRENYLFAQSEKFILKEDRTWLTNVSTPGGAT